MKNGFDWTGAAQRREENRQRVRRAQEKHAASYEKYQQKRKAPKVRTSNPMKFDDQTGTYFVMGPGTNRTWIRDFAGAAEHGHNLITNPHDKCDDLLIVKVVGRIRKRPPTPPPIDIIKYV